MMICEIIKVVDLHIFKNLYIGNLYSFCFLAIILIMCPGYASQVISLDFLDSVSVRNEKIVLSDIAKISFKKNINGNEKTQFTRFKIGEAAPAGHSRFVNVNDILNTSIRHRFKNVLLSTSGATRVKIYTEAYFKTVGEYKKQIISYLENQILWPKNDFTINLINPKKKWRCIKKTFDVSFDGLKSPYPKGNIKFYMKVTQGKKIINIPVMCKIKVKTSVVCVVNKIFRNDLIKKENLKIKKMDITSFRYTPFTKISSLLGNIAVKTLSSGTIIHKLCLKPIPDICKGDHIFITLRKGKIRLSVPARAREEGVKGDRIWVENLKSHKLIKVIILGRGLVSPVKGESI